MEVAIRAVSGAIGRLQIAIVNYGLGNLTSVAGAVRAIGFEPMVTSDPADVIGADRIILPGVGAFGEGMRLLREKGMLSALDTVRTRRPILGICLGAQMMCRQTEEFGRHDGLGWFDAQVRLLRPEDTSLRVPHVGWDNVNQSRSSVLFDDIPCDALFYYVHSFGIFPSSSAAVIGICEYGQSFVAAFEVENIFGVQFHPEKSQKHGLQVLRNFITKAS